MTVVPVYMGPIRQILFDDQGVLHLGDIMFPAVGDKVIVTIMKATSEKDPRPVYDLSALAIDTSYGFLEDAIKKMWTQATRRTTLSKGGIGASDESESSPSWVAESKPTAPRRVAPKSTEVVDLPIPKIPDNVKDGPEDAQEPAGEAIPVEATVVPQEEGNGAHAAPVVPQVGPRGIPRRGRPAVKPPVEG